MSSDSVKQCHARLLRLFAATMCKNAFKLELYIYDWLVLLLRCQFKLSSARQSACHLHLISHETGKRIMRKD